MADIVLSSGDYMRPYRSPWGQPVLRYAPESTTQSYRYGDLVQDLDGRVQIASTSGSTVTSTSILGIASEAASSVANTKRGYYHGNPNVEFWGRTRGGLTQSSNVNAAYGIFHESTLNIWLVDLGNAVSTSQRVIVTEAIDSTGSSGGAVAFVFGTYNSTLVAFAGRTTA